ncbi:MAG: molybdopterin cofactor-binding domain-containing protein [Chloroflexota bacterium]
MSKTAKTTASNPRKWRLTRRRFLIGMGAGAATLAVGAAIGVPIALPRIRQSINQMFILGEGDMPAPTTPDSPFVWFEIGEDNVTHLYVPKIEMGQGIHTTMAQIAAEELELDWNQIEVHQADMAHGFEGGTMMTFGSLSTLLLYQPIRETAATMREMLRDEAARQFGTTTDEIVAKESVCSLQSDSAQQLTYGEIVSNKQGEWIIPETAPALKSVDEFTKIGQSLQRVDFHEKLTGRAIYGFDARMPNTLYGAIARPPRYGARLQRAAAGTAEEQPGVVAVVIEDGFAGVVAERRMQAYTALQELDLEWVGGAELSQEELEQIVTVGRSGIVTQDEGSISQNLGDTPITAEYRTPLAAHAHLEPQAATVDVQPDQVMAYISTQIPNMARDEIAAALNREPEQINILPTYLGGGFGRKAGHDVGVEAARLSAAVGQPVHVGWDRVEDMRYGYMRQPTHHVFQASLDEQGNVLAFEHQVASGDIGFAFEGGFPGGAVGKWLAGADPFAGFGSLITYDNIPNRRVVYHRAQIPVPTGYWRGLGLFPNTFAMESFIDEVAHAAGADPLEFRLRHLSTSNELSERFRAVLQAAADKAGWDTPPPEGRARGIASSLNAGTVATQIAEVSVTDGKIRVHKVTCAIDPGLVINPDGARAQVEGSIIMGLSSTLYERATINNGMIQTANFSNYPLISMRDTPEIDVVFIDGSDEPIGGMGEPAIGPIAAAVGNAVFALTGERLRELPLTLNSQSA